jgi:hypothetical protein
MKPYSTLSSWCGLSKLIHNLNFYRLGRWGVFLCGVWTRCHGREGKTGPYGRAFFRRGLWGKWETGTKRKVGGTLAASARGLFPGES